MEKAPIITLHNGVRIVNFSSPHPFNFVTGEILPGCSSERANHLMLQAEERLVSNGGGWKDMILKFNMSKNVWDELSKLNNDSNIDIILVPLPVMQAWKTANSNITGKLRTCRVADRVSKKIYSDIFCI